VAVGRNAVAPSTERRTILFRHTYYGAGHTPLPAPARGRRGWGGGGVQAAPAISTLRGAFAKRPWSRLRSRRSGVIEIYFGDLARHHRPTCLCAFPADGYIPRSSTPWPSVQRRIPLLAQAQRRMGVRPPTEHPIFVAALAVAPLRWSAKARTRSQLPLILGRGWAARIRDVHCPDPGQFRRASFSSARGRSSLRGKTGGGAASRGVKRG
jgi:hypothetical protein